MPLLMYLDGLKLGRDVERDESGVEMERRIGPGGVILTSE